MHHLSLTKSALAAIFVVSTSLSAFALEDEDVAKQTAITISKATTRITEPLDAEGYVDYVEAVNRLQSQGVTADNNFEVVVRQVLGSGEIREDLRAEYFRRLGIAEPAAEAGRFVGMQEHFNVLAMTDQERTKFFNEFDRIMERPWKKADSPRDFEWLTAMSASLDELVEGSRRSHDYTPYLASPQNPKDPSPRLLAVLLPSVQQQRSIARSLQIRAMYRLGNGDLDGAWSDLQGIHRMARHVASGITLIEVLVGIALDATAFEGEKLLIAAPMLKQTQAERYLKEHLTLPPLPRMAMRIDVGERFMGLDAVQSFARQNSKSIFELLKSIQQLSHTGKPASGFGVIPVADQAPAKSKAIGFSPDWNLVLTNLNVSYDKLVDAVGETDAKQRRRKLDQLAMEQKTLREKINNPLAFFAESLISLNVAESTGNAISDVLTSLLTPAVHAAQAAEMQGDTRLAVMQIALAARVYEFEHGAFPKSVSELQPALLKKIAVDPQTGEPLSVSSSEERFLVYGVGRNGKDDAGRGQKERTGPNDDSDDIAVNLGAH